MLHIHQLNASGARVRYSTWNHIVLDLAAHKGLMIKRPDIPEQQVIDLKRQKRTRGLLKK